MAIELLTELISRYILRIIFLYDSKDGEPLYVCDFKTTRLSPYGALKAILGRTFGKILLTLCILGV